MVCMLYYDVGLAWAVRPNFKMVEERVCDVCLAGVILQRGWMRISMVVFVHISCCCICVHIFLTTVN